MITRSHNSRETYLWSANKITTYTMYEYSHNTFTRGKDTKKCIYGKRETARNNSTQTQSRCGRGPIISRSQISHILLNWAETLPYWSHTAKKYDNGNQLLCHNANIKGKVKDHSNVVLQVIYTRTMGYLTAVSLCTMHLEILDAEDHTLSQQERVMGCWRISDHLHI